MIALRDLQVVVTLAVVVVLSLVFCKVVLIQVAASLFVRDLILIAAVSNGMPSASIKQSLSLSWDWVARSQVAQQMVEATVSLHTLRKAAPMSSVLLRCAASTKIAAELFGMPIAPNLRHMFALI